MTSTTLIKYATQDSSLSLVYKPRDQKPYYFEVQTHSVDLSQGLCISSKMDKSDVTALFEKLEESILHLDNLSDESENVPSKFMQKLNGEKHFIKAKNLKEYRLYLETFKAAYLPLISNIEAGARIARMIEDGGEEDRRDFLADSKSD
jgi:hypothetical protein